VLGVDVEAERGDPWCALATAVFGLAALLIATIELPGWDDGILAMCSHQDCRWWAFVTDDTDPRHCDVHPGAARRYIDDGDVITPGCFECRASVRPFTYAEASYTDAQFLCSAHGGA
jgi:hypothetical protein